ncbi:MAG: S-layer homology domain-containing protein [Peptococcaceae bacterium]|nr:S-layer homology domain-containing protein [Peptococcaceae bacterium]
MKKHHLFSFWKQHAIKIGATVLTGCMLFAAPAQAAEPFTDVPSNHWAAGVIEELRTLGFSDGIGDNQFGLGQTITRAQFAAFIAKVQGYSGTYPQAYTDNTDANAWYYSALNAMAANRVTSPDGAFRPNDPITRAEMTEMMIGALGFYDLGSQLNQVNCPFTDVTDRKGYITLASDLGLAGGMSATTFAPQATATREQAAAMLVRLYHTNDKQLDELHGFYAISSASQSSYLSRLDSTGFGWARLTVQDGQAVLNTTASGQNEYRIPNGFTEPVQTVRQSGGKALLSIYADDTNGTLTQILSSPAMRTEAVQQIAATAAYAERDEENTSFHGVVIDFEALRGAQKHNLTLFLQELRTAMGSSPIYVAVHPVMNGSAYYDGYDYASIGRIADRVILMAYDYDPAALTDTEMAQGYTMTPMAPLNQVYIAIQACLDGGIPAEKLLLGLSMDTVQWKLQDGAVINRTPYHPAYDAVSVRLSTGCSISYPNYSYVPYASYTNAQDNTQNILWYEDERSIKAKAELARLMGIRGLSLWRLGTIPTDSANGLNIWAAVNEAVK